METEIILIRHGETEWNRNFKYQGQIDIKLNDRGYLQAVKLKKYLAEENLDAVISSDLQRALITARQIAEPHQLQVEEFSGLREIDFGEWEGLTYQEITEKYPKLYEKWTNDPCRVAPPEGELLTDFQKRVMETYDQILANYGGQKIAVISHGGSIRIFLASLFQIPIKKYWQLEVDNTSISIVKFYDDTPYLKVLNCSIHLEMF